MFKKFLMLSLALGLGSYFIYKNQKVRFDTLEFLVPFGFEKKTESDDICIYSLEENGVETKRIAVCHFPVSAAESQFKLRSNLITEDKILKEVVPEEVFEDSWNLIILDKNQSYFVLLKNLSKNELAFLPYTFKIGEEV